MIRVSTLNTTARRILAGTVSRYASTAVKRSRVPGFMGAAGANGGNGLASFLGKRDRILNSVVRTNRISGRGGKKKADASPSAIASRRNTADLRQAKRSASLCEAVCLAGCTAKAVET